MVTLPPFVGAGYIMIPINTAFCITTKKEFDKEE